MQIWWEYFSKNFATNTVGPLEVDTADIEVPIHWVKIEETEKKNILLLRCSIQTNFNMFIA